MKVKHILYFVFILVLLCSSGKINAQTWNFTDGSVTSSGNYEIKSYTATLPDNLIQVGNMFQLDYASLFDPNADQTGGIIANISDNASVELRVYSYTGIVADKKLLYSIVSTQTSFDYIGTPLPNTNISNDNVKILSQEAAAYVTLPDGKTPCAPFKTNWLKNYIYHINGGYFNSNWRQCDSWYQPKQPVIIEIKLIGNVTLKKVKIPGIGELTPIQINEDFQIQPDRDGPSEYELVCTGTLNNSLDLFLNMHNNYSKPLHISNITVYVENKELAQKASYKLPNNIVLNPDGQHLETIQSANLITSDGYKNLPPGVYHYYVSYVVKDPNIIDRDQHYMYKNYLNFYRVLASGEITTYHVDNHDYQGVPVFALKGGMSAEFGVQKSLAALKKGISHTWHVRNNASGQPDLIGGGPVPVYSSHDFLENSIKKTLDLYNQQIGNETQIETVFMGPGVFTVPYAALTFNAPYLPLHFLVSTNSIGEVRSIVDHANKNGYSCFATSGWDPSMPDVGVSWIKLLELPAEYKQFFEKHGVKNIIFVGMNELSFGETLSKKLKLETSPDEEYGKGSIYIMTLGNEEITANLKKVLFDFNEYDFGLEKNIGDWESGIYNVQIKNLKNAFNKFSSPPSVYTIIGEDSREFYNFSSYLMLKSWKKNASLFNSPPIQSAILNEYLIGHPGYEFKTGKFPILYWQSGDYESFASLVSLLMHYKATTSFPTLHYRDLEFHFNSKADRTPYMNALKPKIANVTQNNWQKIDVWNPADGMEAPCEKAAVEIKNGLAAWNFLYNHPDFHYLNIDDLKEMALSKPQNTMQHPAPDKIFNIKRISDAGLRIFVEDYKESEYWQESVLSEKLYLIENKASSDDFLGYLDGKSFEGNKRKQSVIISQFDLSNTSDEYELKMGYKFHPIPEDGFSPYDPADGDEQNMNCFEWVKVPKTSWLDIPERIMARNGAVWIVNGSVYDWDYNGIPGVVPFIKKEGVIKAQPQILSYKGEGAFAWNWGSTKSVKILSRPKEVSNINLSRNLRTLFHAETSNYPNVLGGMTFMKKGLQYDIASLQPEWMLNYPDIPEEYLGPNGTAIRCYLASPSKLKCDVILENLYNVAQYAPEEEGWNDCSSLQFDHLVEKFSTVAYRQYDNLFERVPNSRNFVAIKGNKLDIGIIDGDLGSFRDYRGVNFAKTSGMKNSEVSKYFLYKDYDYLINLDGGSSAQIWLNGRGPLHDWTGYPLHADNQGPFFSRLISSYLMLVPKKHIDEIKTYKSKDEGCVILNNSHISFNYNDDIDHLKDKAFVSLSPSKDLLNISGEEGNFGLIAGTFKIENTSAPGAILFYHGEDTYYPDTHGESLVIPKLRNLMVVGVGRIPRPLLDSLKNKTVVSSTSEKDFQDKLGTNDQSFYLITVHDNIVTRFFFESDGSNKYINNILHSFIVARKVTNLGPNRHRDLIYIDNIDAFYNHQTSITYNSGLHSNYMFNIGETTHAMLGGANIDGRFVTGNSILHLDNFLFVVGSQALSKFSVADIEKISESLKITGGLPEEFSSRYYEPGVYALQFEEIAGHHSFANAQSSDLRFYGLNLNTTRMHKCGGDLPASWNHLGVGKGHGNARYCISPSQKNMAYSYSYSHSYDGTFYVSGNGEDGSVNSDNCYYAFMEVKGDAEIVARVENLSYLNNNTNAGITIRENINSDAKKVELTMYPFDVQGGSFRYRSATGGNDLRTDFEGLELPEWVKLTRTNNTFMAYTSADGITWTERGSVDITMGSNILVGLKANSNDTTQIVEGVYTNVTITGEIVEYVPCDGTLPAGWKATNVNNGSGSETFCNDTLKIDGGTEGSIFSDDDYRYVYQEARGDMEIIARLDSFSIASGETSAEAAFVISEGLTPGSQYMSLVLQSGIGFGGSFSFYRDTVNGEIKHLSGYSVGYPRAKWFRLKRSGDAFNAYFSFDGINWNPIFQRRIDMNGTLNIGLAAAKSKAFFTNITITADTIISDNEPPVVNITSPVDGATATQGSDITLTADVSDIDGNLSYVEFIVDGQTLTSHTSAPYSDTLSGMAFGSHEIIARACDTDGACSSDTVQITVCDGTLPAGLTAANVGTGSGSETFCHDTLKITGGSGNIYADDNYHYVYQEGSGDMEIIVRLHDMPHSTAGISTSTALVIRESLNIGSKHVSLIATTAGYFYMRIRETDGGINAGSLYASATYPEWLRLKRSGDTFTAYHSEDGVSWTEIGSIDVTMSDNLTIGLAAINITATFTDITVTTGGVVTNTAPVVNITSPVDGATATQGSDITLTADASDIDGNLSYVEFIVDGQTLTSHTSAPYSDTLSGMALGSHEIIARACDTDGACSSDTVQITVTEAPCDGTLPAGWKATNVGTGSGSETFCNDTLKITGGSGNIYTDDNYHYIYQEGSGDMEIIVRLHSIPNFSWGVSTSTALVIRESLNIGSKHVSLIANTAGYFYMRIRETDGGTNAGSLYASATYPEWLRLKRSGDTFTAYHSEDGVSWTEIGSIDVTMSGNLTIGLAAINITATFTDITVTAGEVVTNTAPVVNITSPVDGATATQGSDITLTADASDIDGNLSYVEFIVDGQTLTSHTSAPYSDTLSGMALGSHEIIARACDTDGACSSDTVQITVTEVPCDGTLPAGWTAANIGTGSGSETFCHDTLKITGGSGNIYSEDNYHYVYQEGSGDMEIIVRLHYMPRSTAGVSNSTALVIRESLNIGSKHVSLIATTAGYFYMRIRETDGGTNAGSLYASATYPEWLRLKRSGDTFTAYHSEDGVSWTEIGSIDVTMSGNLTIGLAAINITATFTDITVTAGEVVTNTAPMVNITSPVDGATATQGSDITLTADVSDIDGNLSYVEFIVDGQTLTSHTSAPYSDTLSGMALGSHEIIARACDTDGACSSDTVQITVTEVPCDGTLPAGWTAANIGTGSGSETFCHDTLKITGGSGNIYTDDNYHYVYQEGSGDMEIIVRLHYMPRSTAGVSTSTALVIRESLNIGSKHVSLIATTAGYFYMRIRETDGGTNAGSLYASATYPEWLRLKRSGDTFTAYHSEDGVSWTEIGSIDVTMSGNLTIGLAATNITATFTDITVTAGEVVTNTAPVVNITSPVDGATATQGSDITLTADASDIDGNLSYVEFIVDGQTLTSHTSAPYSDTLSGMALGSHEIIARACDTDGACSSDTVQITVTEAPCDDPLPADWKVANVGTGSGSENFCNDTLKITGGPGIIYTDDNYHYVYQEGSGDMEIIVRLQSIYGINWGVFTSTALVIRESLNIGSKHVSLIATTVGYFDMRIRETDGSANTGSITASGTYPEWLRLKRSGDTFTTYHSEDGVSWTEIGSVDVTMSGTLTIGLAVTNITATFTDITVTTGGVVTNTSPVVNITSPVDGATATQGSDITLTADASDIDGNLSYVEFIVDGQTLTSHTSAPYSDTLSGMALGSHEIIARACDTDGACSSDTVQITVTEVPCDGTLPAEWTAINIGMSSGSETFCNDTLKITGTGKIYFDANFKDQYHYIYQEGSGDMEIIAKLNSLPNKSNGNLSETALVIRESLDRGSKHVSLIAITAGSFYMRIRKTEGSANTGSLDASDTYPEWLRLKRSGDTFTTYHSEDGVSWTEIGSIDVTMSGTLTIGIAAAGAEAVFSNIAVTTDGGVTNTAPVVNITSPVDGATATQGSDITLTADASDIDGNLSYVEFIVDGQTLTSHTSAPYSDTLSGMALGSHEIIARACDTDGACSSDTVQITVTEVPCDGTLPAEWTATNIGTGSGSETFCNDTLKITGTGKIYFDTNFKDNYHYIYQEGSGDMEIIAKLNSQPNMSNGNVSETALVIRDNLDPGAKHVSLIVHSDQSIWLRIRKTNDAANTGSVSTFFYSYPKWIKLTRVGDTFTGYYSDDGVTWTKLGNIDVTMSGTLTIGIAAAGAETVFSNIAVTTNGGGTNQPPTVSIIEPTNNESTSATTTTAYASVADADGTISKVEFFFDSNLICRLLAPNYSNTPTAYYCSIPLSNYAAGTYELKVTAYDNDGATTTKFISLTILEEATNQPPTVSIIQPANYSEYTEGTPFNVLANASDPDGTISQVKFYRDGVWQCTSATQYQCSQSNLPAGTYTFTAVAYDNDGATTTSSPITVTIKAKNQPPTVTITHPVNYSEYTEGTPFNVLANASDPDGTISQVKFYRDGVWQCTSTTQQYQCNQSNLSAGTYTFTAVAYDNDGATTTSSPITVTIKAKAPNQSPTVTITQPANYSEYTEGTPFNVLANASDPDGTISQVKFYRDGVWQCTSATQYQCYQSNLPAGTYTFTAVAYDNDGATTTSSPITVTIKAPNQPPTVEISDLSDGAVFDYGKVFSIYANAIDPDGYISKVEFYFNGSRWHTDNTSPFSYNPGTLAVGIYTIYVIAYDNDGASATSGTITITIKAPNQSPTVSITQPANNSEYTEGTSFNVLANASDPDGYISKVEFYINGSRWNIDNTSPFSYNPGYLTVGTHTIYVIAYDNDGASATSGTITITIKAPNQPPTVEISDLPDGAVFDYGKVIVIDAYAIDPDGYISEVEFYFNGSRWHTDNTSPFSYNPGTLAVGTYTIYVIAYDNDGASATSGTITITVNAPNQSPTVSITQPVNNSEYTEGTSFNVLANASDPDGYISKVEFYINGSRWNIDNTSPFSYNPGYLTVGTHTIYVIAYDNDGASATSGTITITIKAPNQPPTVEIGDLPDGAVFDYGKVIVIDAYAIDPDGYISEVEFYINGSRWHTDNTSPFKYNPGTLAAGTYTIYVIAYDNDGASATSGTITITVNAPNQPPTVEIIDLIDGTVFDYGKTFVIYADASDPDGYISKVEFYINGSRWNIDNTSPFKYDPGVLTVGTHTIYVIAYDNDGASATSGTITITIRSTTTTTSVSVRIKLDENASDNSWKIKDSNGNVKGSVSFTSTDNDQQRTHNVTLDAGTCYTIYIYDSYGDGISDGWFDIYEGNTLLTSANPLGTSWGSKSYDFCTNSAQYLQIISGSEDDNERRMEMYPNPMPDFNADIVNIESYNKITDTDSIDLLTLNCEDGSKIPLDAEGGLAITGQQIVTFTGGVGAVTLDLDPAVLDCNDVGTTTITVTASDAGGSRDTCKAVVAVVDETPPVAVCRDIITVIGADGTARITASEIDNGSYDNCEVELTIERQTFGCEELGTHNVTLTATDPSGNSSECSAKVTVIDESLNENCCTEIKVPQLLTPNGDQKNDELIIENIGCYETNELIVFDCLKRKVYSKTNYGLDGEWWDGTLDNTKGKIASGVYFYLLILNGDMGKTQTGYILVDFE